METIILTREELYNMVWAEPMVALAKKYNITDTGLRKICIRLQIPLPKSGHWQKVRMGKRITVPHLVTKYSGEQQIKLEVAVDGTSHEQGTLSPYARRKIEIENELKELLVVPDKLKNPNELVKDAKEQLEKDSKSRDHKGLVLSARGKLSTSVAKESIARAMLFWDTFIKCMKVRGHHLEVNSSGTYVECSGEYLKISLREKQNRTLVESGRWNTWDYTPIGKFVFKLELFTTIEWVDGKHTIEQRLASILASLELKAEELHGSRIKKEKEEEERRENRRNYRELVKHQEKELHRFKQLLNDAERWRQAKLLREYVIEVGEIATFNNNADSIKEWSDWALKKADWLDPKVQADDSLMTEVNKDTLSMKEMPFNFWH